MLRQKLIDILNKSQLVFEIYYKKNRVRQVSCDNQNRRQHKGAAKWDPFYLCTRKLNK